MTYIKPEPTTNQLLISIQEILQLGLKAAEQQDWSTVNYYLKLLPQTQDGKLGNKLLLTGENWQLGFNLAISTLIEADFQQQWEVQKLIPGFGRDILIPLIELLQDETLDPDIRWFICPILGNFPEPQVIVALVELLQQTQALELREIVGQTLITLGTAAINALESLLAQPEYRSLAVQSLFYIRTVETIPLLLEVAQDTQPELRAIAIQALGSFHDPRIPPLLIAALEDKFSSVRQAAVNALGFRPDLAEELDLVNRLQPLLSDLNLQVCRETAIALGRMTQVSATTALFSVLEADTTPSALKLDLVKALGWSKLSQGIDYLEKALVTSTGIVTQEIITTLGRITLPELKPQAAQVLVNWWQTQPLESSLHKSALATAFGELRNNCAREILQQLAADRDRKVKLYAQSALHKLG